MTCDEAREQFSAWVDGALPSPEREQVAAHLAACPECARELDRFTHTVRLLSGVGRPRAPVGFVDRVMEAVRREPWHRRALRFILGPRPVQVPVSIGATAVIAALTVYLYQHVPEPQQAAWWEAPPAVERIEPLTPIPAEPIEPAQPGQPGPVPPSPGSFRTPAAARRAPAPSTAPPSARAPAPAEPAASPGALAAEATAERAVHDRAMAERPRGEPEGAAPTPSGPKAERRDSAERPAAPAGPARPGVPSERDPIGTPRGAAPAPAGQVAKERQQEPSSGVVLSRAARAPDLVGRLTVTDRAAGLVALDRLAAGLGATGLGRRPDPDATMVELMVPRPAYERLEPGLRAIGAWEPEMVPGEPPAMVRVLIRVTGQ